ncbi:Cyclin-U3-1 [Hibiscus syriacus]|uniref:Cyclin-U3-1 n=1 Tax=Hibiscus syriacus TaxID=106335 RepID=A0A6A2ZAC3_HIBSY|nr:cyclin-P3-1-like [Hibiscus syriacus]KAE8688496.1 Cyclin-U3-1 [Hibiscus syriacus]
MATLMGGGKPGDSNPYIGLGFDDSGNWIPGTPTVLSLLSSVLERSVRGNEKLLVRSKIKDSITIFHGSKEPSLNIRQYVERIFKYCKCSNSCFVVAVIYIDRFLQRIDAYLTSLNVHRLLITSVLVAAKFMDDQCYNNAYYAKVGGVSREELNRLEMKFLFNLDFRLHVKTDVFDKYWLKIQQEDDGESRTDQHIHRRRSKKDDTRRGRRITR